jgi:hypothetical protein
MNRSTLSLTSALDGEWVVKATTLPLYPQESPGTHCIGGWWASEPVWAGGENLARTGIRSADRPLRSESLYQLRDPGPGKVIYIKKTKASQYNLIILE